MHGATYESLGYRLGDLSYISDVSLIPAATLALMAGSQMVVLDALNWDKSHASHLSAVEAMAYVDQLRPAVAYLTGFAHMVNHAEAEALVRCGFRVAAAGDGWLENEDGRTEGGRWRAGG